MNSFGQVFVGILSTVALIGCLWWANTAMRQLGIARRYNLSAATRLLAVLAVGGMVFTPVNIVINGFYTLFIDYYGAGYKVVEVLGALAIIGFIAWLYSRALLE